MGYFVSVTRAKMRSLWFLPGFAREALRSTDQVQDAEGFQGGALLPQGLLAFWTMTVWDSEASMRAYMLSGPHRRAMPKFVDWCDEASVVHWEQPSRATPSWAEAERRMHVEGRPSKLRHPSRRHADMSFPPLRNPMGGGALTPRRATTAQL